MNMRKIAIGLLAFALVAPSIASVSLKDKKEKKPKTEKKAKVDNKTKTNKASSSNSPRKVQTINDVEAAILGIEKIVSHTLVEVEPIVQQICESQQTKKSVCPRIYVGAANAFWLKSGVSDTTYALKYIDKAIELDPHYGPAYMLKGDIYKWADDTTLAVNYYKKAMEMAPNDFRTYHKYAKFIGSGLDKVTARAFAGDTEAQEEVRRRRAEMEAVYKTAKDANPTFPYELECARLYTSLSLTTKETKKGIQFFEAADQDSLNANDYAQRCNMMYQFIIDAPNGNVKLNAYNSIVNVLDSALMKFPTDYYILANGLNYLNGAYTLVKRQNGEALAEYKNKFSTKALEYGERLMATKDTLINNDDIYRYGIALMNRYKQQQGVDVLQGLMARPNIDDKTVSKAMNAICEAYRDLGEYEKAENAYEELIKTLDAKGSLQVAHYTDYASMLKLQAEESFGQQMIDTYMKACKVYERGAEKFPEYAPYLYYYAMQVCKNDVLDPDKTLELAIKPAKKAYDLLKNKERYEGDEDQIMNSVCFCLVDYYYNKKKDYPAAKQYVLKYYQLVKGTESEESFAGILRRRYKMKI
jgi:tetratricopeptide (TPR) repeat protein